MAFGGPEPLERSHDLEGFECGEPALDDWLKRHALSSQSAGTARVFVARSPDGKVAGYYALAAAQVEPPDATDRLTKGQAAHRPVPVLLLARLAVDSACQQQGLGAALLRDAMLRCLQVSEEIGIRALVVHAKHPTARDWYSRWGFEESPTDPLHLILLMKDLRRFLGQ